MAKPRIFVSSTYYDLKYIRDNLERFISQMGYDPVLFEKGDIVYEHDLPLDESAYKEIENCHMQILIIGGRYGSSASSSSEFLKEGIELNEMYKRYNSITRAEYEKARNSGMPIFIFVDKGVYSEYQTYKKNRNNKSVYYAHVDNINIFILLDDILSQKFGHYVKDFENFEDISSWLIEQWAGLFGNYLIFKNTEQKIKTIESQIDELKSITIALKKYSEALMRKIQPDNFDTLIQQQDENIVQKQIERFANENIIIYIRNHTDLQTEEIFIRFNSSNNLLEFLENLDIEESKISEGIKERMNEDFVRLKGIIEMK